MYIQLVRLTNYMLLIDHYYVSPHIHICSHFNFSPLTTRWHYAKQRNIVSFTSPTIVHETVYTYINTCRSLCEIIQTIFV